MACTNHTGKGATQQQGSGREKATPWSTPLQVAGHKAASVHNAFQPNLE